MKHFADFLAPCGIETFLAEFWTQKALYIPATDPQRFEHLFTWDDLNHLLNFHRLRSPDLRFHQGGESLPDVSPRQWRDRLHQGATLILNNIHERVPPVAQFAAALQRELGHRTQVNLYLSPPTQQGFNCHYDTHEVFILQLDGVKEWFLYESTVAYPTRETRTDTDLPPDTPPLWQGELKPGDLLYIPRGHWHYAITNHGYSLHLTLGISSPTGLDWLEWAIAQLQQQPQWRQSLPILNPQVADFNVHLATLSTALTTFLNDPQTAPRYREHLQQQQPPLPLNLPSQLEPHIDPTAWPVDVCFQVSPLHAPQIIAQSDKFAGADRHYTLRIADQQIVVQGLSLRALERLLSPDGCTLWDLADCAPELSLEDALTVIRPLVKIGVLTVKMP